MQPLEQQYQRPSSNRQPTSGPKSKVPTAWQRMFVSCCLQNGSAKVDGKTSLSTLKPQNGLRKKLTTMSASIVGRLGVHKHKKNRSDKTRPQINSATPRPWHNKQNQTCTTITHRLIRILRKDGSSKDNVRSASAEAAPIGSPTRDNAMATLQARMVHLPKTLR